MIRVFAWVALFVTAAAVTFGLGIGLLVLPERVAIFLHEYFAVFPVPATLRARTVYRALGAALVTFACTCGVQIVGSVLRLVFGGR